MFVSPIRNSSPNFGMAHRPQGLIDAISSITKARKVGELTGWLATQGRELDKQGRHITSNIVEETTKRGRTIHKIVGTITDFSDNPAGADIVCKFNPKNPSKTITNYLLQVDNNINTAEWDQLRTITKTAKTLRNSIVSAPRKAPEEVVAQTRQIKREALEATFKKLFGDQAV